MSMKNSNDTIGNGTRDLPTCSVVQPTAPPRAPILYCFQQKKQEECYVNDGHPHHKLRKPENFRYDKLEFLFSLRTWLWRVGGGRKKNLEVLPSGRNKTVVLRKPFCLGSARRNHLLSAVEAIGR
jgi:hypothetical protein